MIMTGCKVKIDVRIARKDATGIFSRSLSIFASIFHLTAVVFLYMNVIKHHITIDGAVEGVKKSTVLGK